MSIGAAILISVILVTIAWQVGVRNAWGKFAKIIAILFAAVLLLLALGFGWIKYNALQSEREEERSALELKLAVQKMGATELNGVSVGMDERDVLYVLGHPRAKSPPKASPWSMWIYDSASVGTFVNFFQGKVRQVRVFKTEESATFREHGVELGDSEFDVLRNLGVPSEPVVIDSDGKKHLRYGPNHSRLSVKLSRGLVFDISVEDEAVAGIKWDKGLH